MLDPNWSVFHSDNGWELIGEVAPEITRTYPLNPDHVCPSVKLPLEASPRLIGSWLLKLVDYWATPPDQRPKVSWIPTPDRYDKWWDSIWSLKPKETLLRVKWLAEINLFLITPYIPALPRSEVRTRRWHAMTCPRKATKLGEAIIDRIEMCRSFDPANPPPPVPPILKERSILPRRCEIFITERGIFLWGTSKIYPACDLGIYTGYMRSLSRQPDPYELGRAALDVLESSRLDWSARIPQIFLSKKTPDTDLNSCLEEMGFKKWSQLKWAFKISLEWIDDQIKVSPDLRAEWDISDRRKAIRFTPPEPAALGAAILGRINYIERYWDSPSPKARAKKRASH